MTDSKSVFTEIYKKNTWADKESVSGWGSSKYWSEAAAQRLVFLAQLLKVRSIADIPCGDGNFISCADLGKIKYTGYEIVKELIAANKERFKDKENMKFKYADATKDIIKKVDLIFCRDLLIHLPNQKIINTLKNFKASGSKWLLVTHCTPESGNHEYQNKDIDYSSVSTGGYRPINLINEPFNLPLPLLIIPETDPGKTEALWNLDVLDI